MAIAGVENGRKVLHLDQIEALLLSSEQDAGHVRAILARAQALESLSVEEVAALLHVQDAALWEEIFDAAMRVQEQIYGKRLVVAAPLYMAHFSPEASACRIADRKPVGMQRSILSLSEIETEAKTLIKQGHKRVLLVMGAAYGQVGVGYVRRCVDAVYAARYEARSLQEVAVHALALSMPELLALQQHEIGAYQFFQETYHPQTHAALHRGDAAYTYDWCTSVFERAAQANIHTLGAGLLLGLYDWRFDLLALLQHEQHLQQRLGYGFHTVTLPRLEALMQAPLQTSSQWAVSDEVFEKMVTVLRLAAPHMGIVMSTRETPELRRRLFRFGVSHLSTGSQASSGGYGHRETYAGRSFSMGDYRSLDDIVRELVSLGYAPSFCTRCYRIEREKGERMEHARLGCESTQHCAVNALSTLAGFLTKHATPTTRKVGQRALVQMVAEMPAEQQAVLQSVVNGLEMPEHVG